jgi:hypothetical protein
MLPVLVEFLRNMGIDVTFGKPATQKLVNEVNDCWLVLLIVVLLY